MVLKSLTIVLLVIFLNSRVFYYIFVFKINKKYIFIIIVVMVLTTLLEI